MDILTNGWIIFFTFNYRTTEKKKRKGIPKRISHQGTSCARICFVLFHNFEVFNEPSSAPSSSVLSFYFSSNILCVGKVLQSGRKTTNLSRTAFFGSSPQSGAEKLLYIELKRMVSNQRRPNKSGLAGFDMKGSGQKNSIEAFNLTNCKNSGELSEKKLLASNVNDSYFISFKMMNHTFFETNYFAVSRRFLNFDRICLARINMVNTFFACVCSTHTHTNTH